MVSWEQCAFVPPSNRYLGGRSGGEKRRMETFNYDSVLAVSPLIYLELKKSHPHLPIPHLHSIGVAKGQAALRSWAKSRHQGPSHKPISKLLPLEVVTWKLSLTQYGLSHDAENLRSLEDWVSTAPWRHSTIFSVLLVLAMTDGSSLEVPQAILSRSLSNLSTYG